MNHLQYENSPYLLQHAHNPVDWYPWGEEALQRTRTEDKPILLSIGYSTCHWCHVMEHESFEDEDVAAYMNAHFINIKLDREERPDLDRIYMRVCELLTGSGGWHLNVFLTLTLRALYPQATIYAVSSSVHVTQKLKMAGASRVIDMYHVSATRIHNILKKPVATKLIDSFITSDSDISFREIVIPEGSWLHGKMADEVDFSRFGILLIGLVDRELGEKFIFVTTGLKHKLDSGDVLVCMGYKKDLDRFEKIVSLPTEPTTQELQKEI